DQLSEHLADLGCRDEIATSAERILSHVIAEARVSERFRHECRDGDRAFQRNAPAQQRREVGLVRHGTGGSRRARTISQRPSAISGSDKIIPMVSPPNRKPRLASGSRKNSAVIRARP